MPTTATIVQAALNFYLCLDPSCLPTPTFPSHY